MNGAYRHIQYFTVIPSTSGFSEWSLSLNYPHQNHATCLSPRPPHTCHMPEYWVPNTNTVIPRLTSDPANEFFG